ncbi:uncharacterized protein LOC106060641 isoform X1 [Biomphalaria glabrata]|uniref:Uncharacterized protein LOC106060641 isoform X1 n=1 Tax=Biomphalaria glabrata TaxID=6526 RepID=A0A2C9L298_BIOGL|nr:uncharacterized protein LOC106060641 isoform X1 [Biomphalaria glabrata]
MAMNNHMEARRRQMFMERVCAARKRLELAENQKESQEAGTSNAYSIQSDSKLNTAQGPSKTARSTLLPFRVNEEGHKNRYRDRHHLAPHCDKAFAVMYPGSDNIDYVSPESRKNSREYVYVERYEMSCKVNGKFQLEGLRALPENVS